MDELRNKQRELRELLVIAGAGEATEPQIARLNELMLEDAELQAYAGKLLLQIGVIRWSADQNVAASLAAIGTGLVEHAAPSGAESDAVESPGCQVAGSGRHGCGSSDNATRLSCRSRRRLSRRLAAWGVAVSAAIAVMVTAWLWNHSNGNRRFELADSVDVSSQDSTSSPSTLGIGKIGVDAGTMRIAITGVGHLVVDGPADFELVTPMRLNVTQGRIRVRVTEPTGYGFVVATPHGEVTDLGTEFGVEVTDRDVSDLVVFQGEVDLRRQGSANIPVVERLIGGEGVSFGKDGQLDRIMSISTGRTATYRRSSQVPTTHDMPLIVKVSDTLHAKDTKQFYEIVQAGLQEDSVAYVDRPYEWNGIDKAGMPEFLLGADYVKTFNDYKQQSFQMSVEVSQPVDLYLFWDKRVDPAEWLKKDFVDTTQVIALDMSPPLHHPSRKRLGKGPGDHVDYSYSIWRKQVSTAGTVTLGSLQHYDPAERSVSMYGIAAVAVAKRNTEPPAPRPGKND
ncbi:MAG: FecR domain-containing protein [Pirellulales bacterium]|nr:FecR domain-containing protein [Pirellulales bacterium]